MSEPTQPVQSTYEYYRPVEVFVVHTPRHRYWLHGLLFFLTIFSTLIVGSSLQYNFINNKPAFSALDDFLPFFPITWALHNPSHLLLGIPFAATLMLILLAHEMGHFLCCKRYGVQATLPFFIPAPTLIGTLGAFIRIKSPIRSRAALFDIGIAGPIAGFVVATVTLFFALALSKPMPAIGPSDVQFGYPPIFQIVHWLLAHFGLGAGQLPLNSVYLHPTAVAAWVGMFATALNLLPGGQLDGGHIIFALAPRAHKWVSWLTVLILIPMGWWLWPGWLIWAALLGISGIRHPRVYAWTEMPRGRKLLALFALLMLLLTLVPAPFHGAAASWSGR